MPGAVEASFERIASMQAGPPVEAPIATTAGSVGRTDLRGSVGAPLILAVEIARQAGAWRAPRISSVGLRETSSLGADVTTRAVVSNDASTTSETNSRANAWSSRLRGSSMKCFTQGGRDPNVRSPCAWGASTATGIGCSRAIQRSTCRISSLSNSPRTTSLNCLSCSAIWHPFREVRTRALIPAADRTSRSAQRTTAELSTIKTLATVPIRCACTSSHPQTPSPRVQYREVTLNDRSPSGLLGAPRRTAYLGRGRPWVHQSRSGRSA